MKSLSTVITGACGAGLFIISTFTNDLHTLIAGGILILSSQLWALIEK